MIHTVGPIWHGGSHGEATLLASCYHNSLHLAASHGFASIAFPAISCGIYDYPNDQPAEIAVSTIRSVLSASMSLRKITLVAFEPPMVAILQQAVLSQSDA